MLTAFPRGAGGGRGGWWCLQEGFDEFLDEFFRNTGNAELMGLVELRKMLTSFQSDFTATDLHNILIEAKAVNHEVSCKGLWVHGETFWQLLHNAVENQNPEVEASSKQGKLNAKLVRPP